MAPLIAAINDDHNTLEIIEAILTDAGYRVLSIIEGNNAYKIVAREQPDLVILDIRLGKSEGGWLILEQLKLDPATAAIPVIVCSGDIRFLREKREHLISKGCGILEKPFDMKDLLAAVTAALPSPTSPSTSTPDTPQPPTSNGRNENTPD